MLIDNIIELNRKKIKMKTIEEYFINNNIKDKNLYNLLEVLNLTNMDIVRFVSKFNILINTKIDDEKEIAKAIAEFIKDEKNDEILRRFGLYSNSDTIHKHHYFEESQLESYADKYDDYLDKKNEKILK